MQKAFVIVLSLAASPALAHHEVIVVTSMLPFLSSIIAIPLAGFAAWRRYRKK